MHRSLTVCEVLYYNALLRLPPQSDQKYYAKMVNKVFLVFLLFYFDIHVIANYFPCISLLCL